MMKPPLIFALLLSSIMIVACGLLGGGGDDAGLPGKLVFSAKDTAGTYQIFTMKANGEELKQLTRLGPSEGAYQPDWSPDGQQILFSSFKEGTSIGPALWVMDTDGSNLRVLYDVEPGNPHVFPLLGNNARWSPDGSKVAFDLCLNCQIATNNDIYVFDTLSKEVRRLTQDSASDTHPTWSPDGQRIAFVSNRDYVEADSARYRSDLYMTNTNGTGLERLTHNGYVGQPTWNNSSNIIAFRLTGSSPGIYNLNMPLKDITKIKDDLDDQVILLPDAWDDAGGKLLITSYQLSYPRENALYIFNVETNALKKVYFQPSYDNANPVLLGADWYIPKNP